MVGFRRSQPSRIKGARTRHVVTFNPNEARPGEVIYVNVQRLGPNHCLLSDSLRLKYDFKNKNTRSWFRNNPSKILQEQLTIKLSGENVYENLGESLLGAYEDLWLKDSVRGNMHDGIASEAVRKKISGDDATNDDKEAITFLGVYGTKQQMKLYRSHPILKDHGLHARYDLGPVV